MAGNENSGRPPFWTKDKIRPALIKARGVISETAGILSKTYGKKCARVTISLIIKGDPELNQLKNELLEAVLDLCESGVIRRAEAGDQRDQHFLLNTQGRMRGYSKTMHVQGSGPDGAIPLSFDLSSLTDEELQIGRALAMKIREKHQEKHQAA